MLSPNVNQKLLITQQPLARKIEAHFLSVNDQINLPDANLSFLKVVDILIIYLIAKA
jgi:hypothetical protein